MKKNTKNKKHEKNFWESGLKVDEHFISCKSYRMDF
jgi:hypothetical protein